MTRLLIVAALIAFVLLTARRLFSAGRRRAPGEKPGRDALGRPERLVCGNCGAEYDAAASGWTCPKCGK